MKDYKLLKLMRIFGKKQLNKYDDENPKPKVIKENEFVCPRCGKREDNENFQENSKFHKLNIQERGQCLSCEFFG
ncbi:MAG: hypothetical protein AABY22_21835 [Nanoarchaeota archaeon]